LVPLSTRRWSASPKSTHSWLRTFVARTEGEFSHSKQPMNESTSEDKLTPFMIRTYIAFDTKDSAALVKKMKTLGVNIGTCGVRTVRLRPMLVFEEAHSKSSHKKFRINAFSHDSVKLTIFFYSPLPD
jgi:hypothetical protein